MGNTAPEIHRIDAEKAFGKFIDSEHRPARIGAAEREDAVGLLDGIGLPHAADRLDKDIACRRYGRADDLELDVGDLAHVQGKVVRSQQDALRLVRSHYDARAHRRRGECKGGKEVDRTRDGRRCGGYEEQRPKQDVLCRIAHFSSCVPFLIASFSIMKLLTSDVVQSIP